jgi:hypothetical protein
MNLVMESLYGKDPKMNNWGIPSDGISPKEFIYWLCSETQKEVNRQRVEQGADTCSINCNNSSSLSPSIVLSIITLLVTVATSF